MTEENKIHEHDEHCHEHHEHTHNHEHTHDHDHTHAHTHTHDGHEHTHVHSHDHGQGDHTHSESELHDADKEMKTLELLLSHWVEHNMSHIEGFEEWAQKAIAHDKSDVADAIYEAIHYMKHANEELEKARELM